MKKIFLICLALALTARADNVVFDTFGPGNTYDPGMAYFVGNGANHYEPGAQFIAGASGNLSTIDLGLTYFTGSDPSFRLVNVFLYGIASALPPGAVLVLHGFEILQSTADRALALPGNATFTQLLDAFSHLTGSRTIPSGHISCI